MFVTVDWISFTFDSGVGEGVAGHNLQTVINEALWKAFPHFYDTMVWSHNFYTRIGRAPYTTCWQREDGGLSIFAHTHLPHALVEIGGVGMDTLGGIEYEMELARSVVERLTRIDIACDIETEVMPSEFVSQRDGRRFKAFSNAVSKTGETCYVGSRTSDRYARCYRYFEPHPRARLLRVEHVLKSAQAKEAVAAMNLSSLPQLAARLGETFGWKHPVWQPGEDASEGLKAWRPERRHGKTVSWLYSQVIPAIIKLHAEDVIDARQVWADEILPAIDKLSNP